MTAIIEIQLPTDLARPLTADERDEAAGLVDLAELLTLLRMRAERATL